jgi:hypothetical protein
MTAIVSKQPSRSNVRKFVRNPPASDPLFDIVSEMECETAAIEDFGHAIALIAESIKETDVATAVQRLAWEITNHIDTLETHRGKLFRALHPNRAHFERVGWPDEQQEGVS